MQLEHIKDFISADSSRYAERFCSRLVESARTLADFPRCGRVVPEFDDETVREIPFYPYRILYKLSGETCHIVVVIHGSRDLERHEHPTSWKLQ